MPTVGLEWMGQTLSPGDDGNPLVRFPVSSMYLHFGDYCLLDRGIGRLVPSPVTPPSRYVPGSHAA